MIGLNNLFSGWTAYTQPTGSMGMVYLPTFYHKHHQNVGKHTIHGSFGWEFDKFHMMICSWITWVRNFPKIRTAASWPKNCGFVQCWVSDKKYSSTQPLFHIYQSTTFTLFFPDFFEQIRPLFKSKDKTQETQGDCFASMDVKSNDVAIVCQDFDRLAKNLISPKVSGTKKCR